jgi:cyclase
MGRLRRSTVLGAAAGIALAGVLARAQNFDKVEIQTEKLTDHVYVLRGAGGNIGLCVGEDGTFLIDDQFAPLTKKIQAAIAAVTNRPVRCVLNTHWHGDHTGGNENLGRDGAVIVAQENVRKRLAMDQIWDAGTAKADTDRALAHVGLPVITFRTDLDFHVNGDDLHVFHVEHAHTDGDAIIHFPNSNVVHMGDTFFNGFYPFIDAGTGGNINGMIAAAEHALTLANATTKIVPGHGPLGDRAALQNYRTMLTTIRDRVRTQKSAGKTLAEVQAAKPSAEFDAAWGKGMLPGDAFIELVYSTL